MNGTNKAFSMSALFDIRVRFIVAATLQSKAIRVIIDTLREPTIFPNKRVLITPMSTP